MKACRLWIAVALLSSRESCLIGSELVSSLQSLQQSLAQHSSNIAGSKDYKKLSWWASQMATLPVLPIIRAPDAIKALISYEDYMSLLQEVTQQNIKQMNDVLTSPVVKGYSVFYAARKIIQAPATIYCWGDFHGDIHTLIASLDFLRTKEKVLTTEEKVLTDEFKIVQGNVFFVFNGDYVDRGWYGAEVHAVLCLLKKNNPHNVFLMHGNHENIDTDYKYGFLKECAIKFKITKFTPKAFKSNPQQEPWATIDNFYKSLPAVLYVGVPDKSNNNYLQFCHGALEFYKLGSLLSQGIDTSLYFERIGQTPSVKLLEKIVDQADQKQLASGVLRALSDQVKYGDRSDINKIAGESDLSKQWPLITAAVEKWQVVPLGYTWGDFNAAGISTSFNPDRSWIFGKSLSDAIFELYGAKNNIVAVFRAHQHSRTSMPGLFIEANRNIYKRPYMNKHFVFTSVATPTMGLPGRGFMKIKLGSNDPEEWGLTSVWSKCERKSPKDVCEWLDWVKITQGTLAQWKSNES